MLRWRLALGILFIGLLIALCWWDHRTAPPGVVLLPLALLLSVAASQEMLWLLSARSILPIKPLVYAGNLAIVASNLIPRHWPANWPADPLGNLGWPMAVFTLLVLLLFCGEMRRYEQPGLVTERLAGGLFALVYVGVLFSFVVQMRWFMEGRLGIPALASLVIVVKMCDIGAYTIGRLFGRHKMAPVLSPGKTIEGAVGGLLFACLGSWFAWQSLLPLSVPNLPLQGLSWLGFGLAVGLAGMAGDLAESLLKRDFGRKDSSNWMPGFGGVLDLLDSILFAAPIAYLFWSFEIAHWNAHP